MPKRGPGFHERRRKIPGALRGEVLMDDADRRKVRQRKERKMLGVAFIVGCVASLIGLYFSPFLRVQNVQVSGTTSVDPASVAAAADIQSESLVSSSFGDVQAKVLAAIPQAKTVEIAKHWPDTVEIIVTERAPWATWFEGEAAYTIDDTGVVLTLAPANAGPIVHSPATDKPLKPGDHVDSNALELSRALVTEVPTRLGVIVTQVEWSNEKGVTVTTDAGYTVVFGDKNNFDYKIVVWHEIENSFGKESMAGHVLDLRYGQRPSYQ